MEIDVSRYELIFLLELIIDSNQPYTFHHCSFVLLQQLRRFSRPNIFCPRYLREKGSISYLGLSKVIVIIDIAGVWVTISLRCWVIEPIYHLAIPFMKQRADEKFVKPQKL